MTYVRARVQVHCVAGLEEVEEEGLVGCAGRHSQSGQLTYLVMKGPVTGGETFLPTSVHICKPTWRTAA